MPTLLEQAETLTQRAATLRSEADQLGAKAELTQEQLAQVKGLTKEADEVDAKAEELRATAESLRANREKLAGYRAPQARRTTGESHEPIVAREKFLEDPMRGFATHRHFFLEVQGAARGGKMSPNLKSLQAPDLRAAAGSDEQSGFSDSYGGFLIPKGVAPGVSMIGVEADPMAGKTRVIPMATPRVSLNARVDKNHQTSVSGGLRVYRRAEASSVTASRMQFEQIDLIADSLMGVAYATEEILRDSPESFASLLEQGFRDEFGARLINERLNGSGAGEFLGIANGAALIDVPKETGQAAATIVYQNLVKMRARCYRYAQAFWYANQDTLPQLLAITAPGSTVPLFTQDAMGVERIFGRPVIFGEFPETLGTVGDIVLGNWSEYFEGTYEPIQGASSIHVRFVEHEQCFKFWMRNAGAPAWRTVLTPKKGSTLAPFVRLATRA